MDRSSLVHPAPVQRAPGNTPSRGDDIPGSFRLSGGPYGGSIGLGGAQIFVSRNGQVSGSLSALAVLGIEKEPSSLNPKL